MAEYDSEPQLEHRKDKNVTDSKGNGKIKTSTTPSTTASHTPYKRPNLSYFNNNYKTGSDIVNRISNYYKYFQRRKPDSYYFGNSLLNSANSNKNVHCNYQNCTHNENTRYYSNDKGNVKGSAYDSYDVRPPYSATFDAANRYNAFTKYRTKSTFSHAKTTTITTKPT